MNDTAAGRLAAVRDRYFGFALERNPVTSTFLGGEGWRASLADTSGRLRDYRAASLADELSFYRSIRDELDAIDAEALDAHGRVDHSLIAAQVGFLLHQIGDLRYHERAVDTYVAEPFRGVDWQLQQMTPLPDGDAGTEGEWRLVIGRLGAVPDYVAVARANLTAGVLAGNAPDFRMLEHDGVAGARADEAYFRVTLPETASRLLQGRPLRDRLMPELAEAARAAADAYAEFARFLGTLRLPPGDHYAIGEAEYEFRVRNNLHEAAGANELWEYGGEQVRLAQERLFECAGEIAAARSMRAGFGSPDERADAIRTVFEALGLDAPADDDELLRWYVEVGRRAVAYGREMALFEVPDEYRLEVVPTPPLLRGTFEAAYYPAAPLKRGGIGRFYLTPTENEPAALAANNRASAATVAVHEGFPGHDWHYRFMVEHADEISSVRWLTPGAVEDSSSMWADSMAIEGWGLYAEELMGQPAAGHPYGFFTLEERFYLLIWQLRRALRVRIDVGLHTGRMGFDEAVDYQAANLDFLPDACARAESDPAAKVACDSARRAVYRYSKWPVQAITYNLGMRAIVELRDAYAAKAGRPQARDFHEWFMAQGTVAPSYLGEVL